MPFRISTLDRQTDPTSMQIDHIGGATDPQLQAVVDAVDAIILGSDAKGVKTVVSVIDGGSAIPPADELAQVGNKWLLRFQDSVNSKIFSHEIGTADSTQLPGPTDDFLDLTAGVGLALKTALDAVYQSPYGNTGVLLSVQQVNRAD